jgi:uncharacterized protein YcbK (DUF882 family)
MQLSKNFKSTEFQCKCCKQLPQEGMNPHLIELLQDIRDAIGKSISITSGYRCQKHNQKVKGAKLSQHVLGNASDIQVSGMSAADVHKFLLEHFDDRIGGLGKYPTFTHVDCRTGTKWRG